MKNKDLLNAIGNAKDEYILEAQPKMKKAKIKRHRFAAAVAAVLVIAIIGGIWVYPGGSEEPNGGLFPSLRAYAIAEPVYPEMAQYPDESKYISDDDTYDYIGFDEAYDKWMESKSLQRNQYEGFNEGLDEFFAETIERLLTDTRGENKVYSPINLYMALGMLAEITDNNSRKQILDLLGYDSIEECRKQAKAIWNANYCDDGAVKSVLASSIWLNEDIQFKQNTLDTLAENYYSSAYQGEMGTEEYDKAMQEWINAQTGDLLGDYSSDIKTDPETVAALIATLYFRAKWTNDFNADNTVKEAFHSPDGDITCDFMKQTTTDNYYYWGEKYTAVSKQLNGAGAMWFILPDEGVSTDELLKNEDAMEFILSDGDSENKKHVTINMSVPKFDVSSNTDLTESFKALGITDVFDDSKSDYTPLCDGDAMYLSKANHAARVVIDEEGCTAAAYTAMILNGTGGPPDEEVDFILNRPFIFVITGGGGLPLFVGVVNQP